MICQKKAIKELRQLIRIYLPLTCGSEVEKGDLNEVYGWIAANALFGAYEGPGETFDLSHDIQTSERIIRNLRTILRDLRSLSPATREILVRIGTGSPSGKFMPEDYDINDDVKGLRGPCQFSSFIADVREPIYLISAILEECQWAWSKSRLFKPSGSAPRRPNIRAATIAYVCRSFWDQELARKKKLSEDEYDAVRGTLAPWTVHSDMPASFGRFIEAVFDILEITGPTDETFKAASALAQAKRLERSQKPKEVRRS